jgi:hypothetical protein
MGKRGPQAGAAQRRILVPRRLVICSDHELVLAQHFNERIDDFLTRMGEQRFPLTAVEPVLTAQVMVATENLQHAIIEGIENYSVRKSPSNHAPVADDTPFLRGVFAMGRKRGRLPIDAAVPGVDGHAGVTEEAD